MSITRLLLIVGVVGGALSLGVEVIERTVDLVVELAGGVGEARLGLDDADDGVRERGDALDEPAVVGVIVVDRGENPMQDHPHGAELEREREILAERVDLGAEGGVEGWRHGGAFREARVGGRASVMRPLLIRTGSGARNGTFCIGAGEGGGWV